MIIGADQWELEPGGDKDTVGATQGRDKWRTTLKVSLLPSKCLSILLIGYSIKGTKSRGS